MPPDAGTRTTTLKAKGGGTPLRLDTKANAVQSLPKQINPTTVHFTNDNGKRLTWHSRRARKGRYSNKQYHVTNQHGHTHSLFLRLHGEEQVLKAHVWGDVTFWVAFTFTWGSILWVVNGFLEWLPYIYPSVGRKGIQNAASWLAFAGGLVFVIGAYLMVVEALSRGRETNFGTAIKRVLTHNSSSIPSTPHSSSSSEAENGGDDDSDERFPWPEQDHPGFVWWAKPRWHDIGYDAGMMQFAASTIFWVATIVGIPGVVTGTKLAIRDVFFWTPQVIGGVGFILCALLLMLEVQHKWWIPRPLDLGWQIAFWNLIGGIGFTLCGALGYAYSHHKVAYQSELATFWASWAFLIASVLQLYEALWRDPPTERLP